jgi:hypothetical protein
MVEYILCYGGPAEHRGPLPATRLASRKILIEQKIHIPYKGHNTGVQTPPLSERGLRESKQKVPLLIDKTEKFTIQS